MNSPKQFTPVQIALALILCSFLFVLATGEAAFRIKNALHPIELSPVIEPAPKLGWRTRPNYHFQGTLTDEAGTSYSVIINTDRNGFRAFGDPHSGRKRVLFIGDSFTFAKDVSQADPYYIKLGEMLDIEVFAYGADGYCTMQEYFILDAWIDHIAPDAVVWQFCRNDFIGNSLELTQGSAKTQCHTVQPFMGLDGVIRHQNPGERTWGRLVAPLHSAFLRALAYRIDNRHGFPSMEQSTETAIEKQGMAFRPFQDAVTVTDKLLGMIKKRCGNAPLILFNIDAREPQAQALRDLCAHHDIPLIEEVPRAIQQATDAGTAILAGDHAHWNAAGHRICAEQLAEPLRKALLTESSTK